MSSADTFKTIEVSGRRPPPAWAVRQRHLIELMDRAALKFAQQATRPDGTLIWRNEWTSMDGTDNGYESFLSYPLFYLLGGGEHVHELARKEWNAITWEFEHFGTVDREFVTGFDWFHHSESYTYIYYLALANPAHHVDRARALRYAGMYIGEDPQAPNWDAARRMLRSPLNGSHGPRLVTTPQDWAYHRPILAHYLAPYEDMKGITSTDPFVKVDWTDDAVFAEVLRLINQRMTRGDVPLNLLATSMVTNAYLYTGEEKYKTWVLDYIQAWMERRDQNQGIVPDNIGPEGKAGELMGGKWWGGYYGWRWPHGARNIVEAACVAGGCGLLLTGDDSWLDLCRSQLDLLWSLRREEGGVYKVPARHGDQGWFDFRAPDPYYYIHLYTLSQSSQDLARLDEVFPERRGFEKLHPHWYLSKAGICYPQAWFAYIEGRNPGYPEAVLESTYAGICDKLNRLEADHSEPETRECYHFHDLNPVIPEGLVQMSTGSPAALYNGGLLYAPVRYFDPVVGRTGLPEHVAALVDRAIGDQVSLTLVNTDVVAPRPVLLQAGTFGEHQFTSARLEGEGELEVQGRYLRVDLGPGTTGRLHLGLKRHVHRPSYDFPPGVSPC